MQRLFLSILLTVTLTTISCTGSKNTVWKYDTSTPDAINPLAFDTEKLANLVHEGINQVREKEKRKPLTKDLILFNAADEQTSYVLSKGKLNHEQNNREKRTVSDRVRLFGGSYDIVGENLQYAGFNIVSQGRKSTIMYPSYQATADQIVQNWIKSKPHYRNFLNKEFSRVGTAVALDNEGKGVYATQVFSSN